MRFVEEFRDEKAVAGYCRALARLVTREWTIMEVCGGQTHAIVRFGLDQLLPEKLTLVHGPGCPVCVTPVELVDRAVDIAGREGVIFCSFGDMIRVPGSRGSLLEARAAGGDVRAVYSPMDAVKVARENPGRQVVFFAVGFETTAPANALAVQQARRENLGNFSLLVAHVLVPPALEAIFASPDNRVQGLLAAGHVCTVMGTEQYEPISRRYGIPVVVTGFEPLDMIQGIFMCVRQLEQGDARVENQYRRSVKREGNRLAQEFIARTFRPVSRVWRGIGEIPGGGLELSPEYADYDAERRFASSVSPGREYAGCMSGEILRGRKKPADCPLFGKDCTPEQPRGATMVSSEGACAAYYRYRPKSRVQ